MHMVIATVTCRPEGRDRLLEVVSTLIQASRTDEGCQSYDFYTSVSDPNTFRSVEMWDSAETAGAHLQQPHVASALEALPDLVAGPPEIMMHEVTTSTQLA
ncbi:MAG: putative quinol monooxygenase [Euzebya sp.]